MRSEVVAVGQNLRSIFSQAGLQLLNVVVTLTLSHRYKSEDPSPTLPTYRGKEEKGKIVEG